jgi:sec-independent protein translocase protein TatC
MLLTPPDILSQLLLAIPTWMLFELGVFLARFIERRSEKGEAEPLSHTDAAEGDETR